MLIIATEKVFIGLYVVIALNNIPIADKARSMDKINWINFIRVYFKVSACTLIE